MRDPSTSPRRLELTPHFQIRLEGPQPGVSMRGRGRLLVRVARRGQCSKREWEIPLNPKLSAPSASAEQGQHAGIFRALLERSRRRSGGRERIRTASNPLLHDEVRIARDCSARASTEFELLQQRLE